ncbi:MAG: hypothetical protein SVK54_06065 [candidate division WOR-3 bacterium]|nr:hypothetical protein [candidate division WOR-3 bacterium]
MNFTEMIDSIKEGTSLKNAVLLNKEDGEVVEKFGETNALLNDTGAFLGSAGEIIREKTAIDKLNYITVKTEPFIIIINTDSNFLALEFESYIKPSDVFAKYSELTGAEEETAEEEGEPGSDIDDLMEAAENIEGEEETISEAERQMFNNKITQINFLVEEFSAEGNNDKWIADIKSSLDSLDKICNCIEFDEESNLKLKDIIKENISRREIQEDSKAIIDSLCKSAVKEFGPKTAKEKVQRVIAKLNKSRG